MKKIVAHKGGRTKVVQIRCTEIEKKILEEVSSYYKMNITDLIHNAVWEVYERYLEDRPKPHR